MAAAALSVTLSLLVAGGMGASSTDVFIQAQAVDALARIAPSPGMGGTGEHVRQLTDCQAILQAAFRPHAQLLPLGPTAVAARTLHLHLRDSAETAAQGLDLIYQYDDVGLVRQASIERLAPGWSILLSRQGLPRGTLAVRRGHCLFLLAAADPFMADYDRVDD